MPLLPVAVVRIIAVNADRKVLIVRRAATRHEVGRWALPGGKIDYGETVAAAAARELMEETGFRATRLRFALYQDSLATEPDGMHCINFYFVGEVGGQPVLNDEATAAAWIGQADLDGYALVFRNGEALRAWWRGSTQGHVDQEVTG